MVVYQLFKYIYLFYIGHTSMPADCEIGNSLSPYNIPPRRADFVKFQFAHLQLPKVYAHQIFYFNSLSGNLEMGILPKNLYSIISLTLSCTLSHQTAHIRP